MAELGMKRNLVLCGHGGAGKTTLAEGLLFKANVTKRWGKVDDGTSHLDTEDDEKERKSSTRAAIAYLTHGGADVTLIDTPGYPDFIGEVYASMPAVETACIVISATDGIGVNTRKVWEMAEEMGRPRVIVVTNIDAEHAKMADIIQNVRSAFGDRCIPVNIPDADGPAASEVDSVFDDHVPDRIKDVVEQYRKEVTEAAVEADDALMEKYLEQGDVTLEELRAVFPKAIVQGSLTPMYFTGMQKEVGYAKLLDAIAGFFPSPADVDIIPKATKKGDEVDVKPDSPFTAQVFRMQSAVVGKQAFLRVWSGSSSSGAGVFNSATGKTQKIGDFSRVVGKETTIAPKVEAGDIVMLSKVDGLSFGDTITAGEDVRFEKPAYPLPMVALAIAPKSRNDETKLGEALHKLTDEDPTFEAKFDADTKQLVARGISELHLQLMLKALKDRYKVEVETTAPRIPYRETITGKAESHHRHKKQSGGAGQFGEVYIRVEPTERGEGFDFVNEIVGGVIPNQFIPAVEKGIVEKMAGGVVAGYPVVDVRVRLHDGKHHPVDSKEVAFKTAGREAFKKAIKAAKPKLLEPVVNLTVVVPAHFMGDITGDLNGRRGRVMGMDQQGDMSAVKAQVPLAEVQTYSASLRSITGGEGSYSIEFSHYDVVPGDVADTIIAKFEDKDEE